MAGRKDMTSPESLRFFTEMYTREHDIRVAWNNANKDMIMQAAVLNREFKGYFERDITAFVMGSGMVATTRDHVAAAYHKYKKRDTDNDRVKGIESLKRGHSILDVGLGNPKEDPLLIRPNSDLRPDPVMRPVHPDTKKLLYKSRPMKAVYIKERNKLSPEEKYYFAECTSWDHGWRQQDSQMKPGIRYGKKAYMRRITSQRVGPQPDPPHYKSPNFISNTKCA